MAGTDVSTGVTTPHAWLGDVIQPLHDGPGVDAVAPVTPTAGQLTGPTYDAMDTTGMAQAQMAAQIAECTGPMAAGMDARNAMLAHYQSQIMPLGSQAGDNMVLPRVPEDASGSATPPAGGYLYGTGEGDQPGRGDTAGDSYATGYVGDEPA